MATKKKPAQQLTPQLPLRKIIGALCYHSTMLSQSTLSEEVGLPETHRLAADSRELKKCQAVHPTLAVKGSAHRIST